jgi:hypothetical protein
MKTILIAAGALLIGAPALAAQPMAPDMAKAVKEVWADANAQAKAGVFATGAAWSGPSEAVLAADEKPLAGDLKPFDKPLGDTLAGELGGPNMVKPGADTAQYTGMGGPLEEVDYPPCSRTVTDRCIQLYERGVHR